MAATMHSAFRSIVCTERDASLFFCRLLAYHLLVSVATARTSIKQFLYSLL